MVKYYLGIDQGFSKTHAIVGDDQGRVLGFAKAYGACHSTNGLSYALEAIRQAADSALEQSKLKVEDLHGIAAGLTGIDWDHEVDLLKKELHQLFGNVEITVVNDCIIAMHAGTRMEYGAVLCAGSGLNCAISSPEGKQFVYGFYIEDEYQGGTALGKACVKAVIDSEVGLEEDTLLRGMMLEHFSLKDVDALLFHKVTNRITDQDYVKLPPILEKAAKLGDAVAQNILWRFGIQFGRYVACGLQKMNMQSHPVDVVLSGSIFKCREPQLRDGVLHVLKLKAPEANIIDAEYEPIVGAYILAAKQAHSLKEDFYTTLQESANYYKIKRNR